ncbi:MAG: DEAD/DEAH box helicase [Patescibacteria group bacterium]|nr:DEAD/DEAH box helicase [Patescibacteria group bacterium]
MTNQSETNFEGLSIAPKLRQILDRNNFKKPTPIQSKTIPLAIQGQDLMGIAQTGTGKTLAFVIPMIQNIARLKKRGLVLVPTRELAAQVNQVFLQFGKSLNIKTAVVIGGASAKMQKKALKNKPHVIMATPGRLIDLLSRDKSILNQVGILTLDEADRMLDMGFAPQIEKIIKQISKKRQTLLFSATMPSSIVSLASRHMHLPLRVEISQSGTTVKEVDQEVIFLKGNEKISFLKNILNQFSGSVLVFCRTKWGTKKLAKIIRAMGFSAHEIHSNRSLAQRQTAIEGFKTGRYRILVATDIAARGIDVKNIEVVINYDLPSTPDDYVHRIGRTARAGKKGKAISFATSDQGRDVRDIERLIKKQLVVSKKSSISAKNLPKKGYSKKKKSYNYSRSRKKFGRRYSKRRVNQGRQRQKRNFRKSR